MKVKANYKEELQFYAEKSENMNDFGVVTGFKKTSKLQENMIYYRNCSNIWALNGTLANKTFIISKNNNTLPKQWHEAKVVAILKPGKPDDDPKSYRLILILNVVYKFF